MTRSNEGAAVAAPPAPEAQSRYHAALLAAAVAVLAAACVLTNDGDARVALAGIPLPELCWWRRWLGWECPGCGLTRSFVALAHGDFWGAWQFKPLGVLLFAIVAAQVPYRLVQLWRGARGHALLQFRGARWLVWLVVAAIGVNCLHWLWGRLPS